MSEKAKDLYDHLRQKAEELLAQAPGSGTLQNRKAEIEKLLHELRVHQIELDIQNEELRKAQLALSVSRDHFAKLFHHAPVGYLVITESAMIIEGNQTVVEMLGIQRRDLLHKPLADFVSPEDRPRFYAHFTAFFNNPPNKHLVLQLKKKNSEYVYTRMDGRRISPGELFPNRNDLSHVLLISLTNIAAQKNAESALQESNAALETRTQELSSLLKCTRHILQNAEFETAARRIFDNAKAVTGATAGYVALLNDDGSENEVLFLDAGGADCTVDPDLPMPIRGLRAEAYHTGNVVFENRFSDSRWMRCMPPGHVRLRNVLFAPLPIDGKIVGLIGLANKDGDFTERDARMAGAFGEFAAIALRNSRSLTVIVQTQERLAQERNQLATTLMSIREGIITTDPSGNIILMNQAAENIAGCSHDQVIGCPIDTIYQIFDAHKNPAPSPVQAVINTLHPITSQNRFCFVRQDGREIFITHSAAPILNAHGDLLGAILVFQDISEKIQLEEQLLNARKMESIGTLAGGIAHDFNNILSIILGNTELLSEDLPDHASSFENVNEIRIASMRGREVVRQLLNYCTQMSQEHTVIDAAAIIRETLQLLRATIPADIKIRPVLPDKPVPVNANAAQIQQILINLCTNAAHAMPQGGDITVELSSIGHLPDGALLPSDNEARGYAQISVSDTGEGIPQHMMDKIFDPYFTTKPVGKGTGLGLSVVQGIVRNHDGNMLVSSRPGSGTQMRVYLPLTASNQYPAEPVVAEKPSGGGERILLVDDEVQIVRMVQRFLERLGYHVTVKVSSPEALAAFKDTPEEFDLIITDMSMPEMTGTRLAQSIQSIRPDLPIILCTGYNESINGKKAGEMGISRYLTKPFVMTEMAEAVREALKKIN